MESAIVTGSSRGIGRAISEELALNGYNVALISRKYNTKHYTELGRTLEELREKIEKNWHWRKDNQPLCLGFECDVSDKSKVRDRFSEIYEKFESIDVLVNNAGINSRKSLNVEDTAKWFDSLDDNLEGFDEEIGVNLRGTFICSYAAAGYATRIYPLTLDKPKGLPQNKLINL